MFECTSFVEKWRKINSFSLLFLILKKTTIIHKFYLTKKYPQPVCTTDC